jgi:putative heme-binding domain-containing protein
MHLSTLPNFVVERVNPTKIDSYVAMTFNAEGRPLVAKEFDYLRWLIDADGDGRYESERILTEKVHSCQGVWFDGPALYATCMESETAAEGEAKFARIGAALEEQNKTPVQGSTARLWRSAAKTHAGLWRIQTNANGEATSIALVTQLLGTVEEHGPHGLRRGPDGELWYATGDNHGSPLNRDLDAERSLVLNDKETQLLPSFENFGPCQRDGVCSALHRVDRQTGKHTVLMGGSRNMYDFAVTEMGEVFSFDSDHEPELGTPWFRPVRTIHAVLGGNYGYRNGSGKYPAWYLDSLPPVRDLNRGSPVGVETYLSYAFPPEFYDNLFEGDWSRGRLLYTSLTPNGATFTARDDQAEFLHGIPLNITDLEVGPDGNLYFTTGGRSSQGGFWRIRYTGPVPPQPDRTGILAVVRQPQPLSSWGWAAIERVKGSMGDAAFGAALEKIARSAASAPRDRVRALYEMQRHGPKPSGALLRALVADPQIDVRTAAVYVAGQQSGADAVAVAAAGLKDANAMVRRRALEAVVTLGQYPARPSLVPVEDIYRQLSDPDRFIRWAARIALERTPRAEWAGRVLKDPNTLGVMEGLLAWVRTAGGESLAPALQKQFALMRQPDLSVDDQLRLLRVFHYTITELPDRELDDALRAEAFTLWSARFPAADDRLSREIALTLAYTQDPRAAATILGAMPQGDEKREVQLHYLYALRTVVTGWTPALQEQLGAVFERSTRWRGGIGNAVNAMFDETIERLPEAERANVYKTAPTFVMPPVVATSAAPAPAAGGRGAGGRGGRGGRGRGAGQDKQETFERLVYWPGLPGSLQAEGPRLAFTGNQMVSPTSGHRQTEAVIDTTPGRQIFESSCASCHKYGAVGTAYGPDLTGHKLTRLDLAEAMFYPDRKIDERYYVTVVETTDGRTIRGVVVTDDEKTLVVKTADADEPVTLAKTQIRARQRERATIMPDFFERTPRINFEQVLAFLAVPAPEK